MSATIESFHRAKDLTYNVLIWILNKMLAAVIALPVQC